MPIFFLSGALYFLLSLFHLLLSDHGAQYLKISGQHSQGDIAFKTEYPIVRASIQTMVLKCVDGRFDRCMLAPGFDKFI